MKEIEAEDQRESEREERKGRFYSQCLARAPQAECQSGQKNPAMACCKN